jgi:hypothetical protein
MNDHVYSRGKRRFLIVFWDIIKYIMYKLRTGEKVKEIGVRMEESSNFGPCAWFGW